jgi:hypothetical protein
MPVYRLEQRFRASESDEKSVPVPTPRALPRLRADEFDAVVLPPLERKAVLHRARACRPIGSGSPTSRSEIVYIAARRDTPGQTQLRRLPQQSDPFTELCTACEEQDTMTKARLPQILKE